MVDYWADRSAAILATNAADKFSGGPFGGQISHRRCSWPSLRPMSLTNWHKIWQTTGTSSGRKSGGENMDAWFSVWLISPDCLSWYWIWWYCRENIPRAILMELHERRHLLLAVWWLPSDDCRRMIAIWWYHLMISLSIFPTGLDISISIPWWHDRQLLAVQSSSFYLVFGHHTLSYTSKGLLKRMKENDLPTNFRKAAQFFGMLHSTNQAWCFKQLGMHRLIVCFL